MRIAACTLLLALSTAVTADDKPVRWEYAEVTIRVTPPRPAIKDKDGTEVPAVPPSTTIKWISKAGEFDVKGWDELAEKLKVPFKKEGSPASQKIQVLNLLGEQGWELIDQQVPAPTPATTGAGTGFGNPAGSSNPFARPTGPTTWMLKRRLP